MLWSINEYAKIQKEACRLNEVGSPVIGHMGDENPEDGIDEEVCRLKSGTVKDAVATSQNAGGEIKRAPTRSMGDGLPMTRR